MKGSVFVDEGTDNGIMVYTCQFGRTISRKGIFAEELDHNTGIPRILIHKQADIVSIAKKADHVADTRLIRNVLFHERPVFIDEGICTFAILFLCNGNQGISIHGQSCAKKLPITSMRSHKNSSFTSFL